MFLNETTDPAVSNRTRVTSSHDTVVEDIEENNFDLPAVSEPKQISKSRVSVSCKSTLIDPTGNYVSTVTDDDDGLKKDVNGNRKAITKSDLNLFKGNNNNNDTTPSLFLTSRAMSDESLLDGPNGPFETSQISVHRTMNGTPTLYPPSSKNNNKLRVSPRVHRRNSASPNRLGQMRSFSDFNLSRRKTPPKRRTTVISRDNNDNSVDTSIPRFNDRRNALSNPVKLLMPQEMREKIQDDIEARKKRPFRKMRGLFRILNTRSKETETDLT